ncbi:MAG: twin-arginine translocase TatA/TatE family subunit [Bacteroidetes bacterium]|nr:twin-arginine translocase TatA/TatE family subunit [Bacteroidota bacterium]
MIQNLLLAFSFQELLPIIIIILILFGGKKIPELMRGMGRGIREFQDAKNNVKKEIEDSTSETNKS